MSRKRITAREFRKMAEAAVFGGDARLELLDGELVEMPPVGPEHAQAVERLASLFSAVPEEQAVMSVESPLLLPGDNEFRPDIVLLEPRPGIGLPHAQGARLIVEVAQASLLYDKELKGSKYADVGVSEYWVVDLGSKGVWTYAQPSREGFLREGWAGEGETLELMGANVPLAELFQ